MGDVARAAGVSRATASYALRGDSRIALPTAEKVRRAAVKLGYTANLSARSLRSGRNGVIGVAIFELDKAYPSQMSAAISREATRRGLQAIVQQTANSQEGEVAVLRKVTSQLCDGTIFSPGHVSDAEISELSGNKPIVLLDDRSDRQMFDTVFTPCRAGAKAAILHLAEAGCRHILVLGADRRAAADEPNAVGGRRVQGALEGFEQAGLQSSEADFVGLADWDFATSRRKVHELVDRGSSFDGLFCMTDSIAFGAIRGLADRGIHAPDDVAVMGFDGVVEDEFMIPSLTTIAIDNDDLACKAVSLLVRRIEAGDGGVQPTRLTARFDVVKRESTRRR
ncbi:DNA-binding transcriptional regulator, LacI/PurR family [Bifidobacterium bohemicum]|uniref:LacI family transcriptional regulator n=1 Tax=Bifidobacterium bohemicum DSM 22767 TaxID=1437606 RepID=A0A086ZK51_9BIFI|nr:LacI family DNA-binding transcriptional regulator [Bifidobacterium bohemicum]KFI46901.1 LacI family transcriptional regulator [Bifidobacterium bohemicum DSM 22767]SCB84437.1 DNA-binding transcriptional regulator, LacI/PurR family [Bifidobacterium bohemicum]